MCLYYLISEQFRTVVMNTGYNNWLYGNACSGLRELTNQCRLGFKEMGANIECSDRREIETV